jgi:hypothetical protein
LDDAFTAASLNAPCLAYWTNLWQTSALAISMVPNHDLVIFVRAVMSHVALTSALVEVKVVVSFFTGLLKARAIPIDVIPSEIGVVTVLDLISASTVIFSFCISPDELSRLADVWTGSKYSINCRYQMLCASFSEA